MKVSVNEVWDETRAFLRAEQALLLPLAFGTIFLARIVVLLIAVIVPAPLSGPLSLLIGLWSTVGELALIALTLRPRTTVREALSVGIRLLPAAVTGFVLLVVATMLIALPLIAAIMRAGYTPEQLQSVLVDRVLLAKLIGDLPGWSKVYAFAVSALALFVSIRIVLWQAALVESPRGAVAAFKVSWNLTRGRFWTLLGLTLLLGLVTRIIDWAATGALGSVLTLIASPLTAQLVAGLLLAAATTLLTLLTTVFVACYYRRATL